MLDPRHARKPVEVLYARPGHRTSRPPTPSAPRVQATDTLPPRLPNRPQELLRAIILLGCLSQHSLSHRARGELGELCGGVPKNPEQAAAWKAALKQLQKWENEEPSAAPEREG